MEDVKLLSVEAFMERNQEQIVLQYEENGSFKECTLHHKFDTVDPWFGNINKDMLKRLLNQFAEKVENRR